MASSRLASTALYSTNGAYLPSAPATTTTPVPDRAPGGWSLDSLCGRFVEISNQAVSITAAGSLILESQLRGEPAAWVAVGGSIFFPPDFAQCGIDLDSLPVIRVPQALAASRVADRLLRSGGFGVIVLDLGCDIDMRIAVQVRLAALAKKHRTTVVCLTQKEPAVPSLGPLVSLRAQGAIHKTGFNRFTWELEILRDKRRGLGWRHTEVCHGPDGLC
jgi:recombination protein RecA